jgi:O-antigen/teichoic acid export membrane protein
MSVMRLSQLARTLRHGIDGLRHPESFLGPVLTLVSGTAVAHGITAVTLIIVARLYAPADLGVLGLFASIFYVLAVIACLRFDIAIPLPEDDGEARDVLWLALLGGISLSAVIGLILFWIPDALLSRAGLAQLAPYLWILPIAILANACLSALQNWHVRIRSYSVVARARVAQSAGASAIQIASGMIAPSPLGLIAGFVFNGGAAAALLIAEMWRKADLARIKPEFSRLKPALVKYRFYPCFSTWEAMANSAAIQLPILLIGILVSEAEVGQLLLATSVVQAPMALFGTATSQVFLSQAPERARQGRLYETTIAAIKTLLRLGVPLLAVIAIASPFVFPILFGEDWGRAGVIATWMAPWLLLQFIASPISMVFYITGRQGLALATQVGGLIFRTFATWAGAVLLDGKATEAYAVSGALFYGMIIFVLMHLGRSFGLNVKDDREAE